MLNQPPIFLGGQGGIIGPARLGFGNVVAAGSVLHHDYPGDNQLIFEQAPAGSVKNYRQAAYPGIGRVVKNNILYLANLTALEMWYTHIRKPFLEAQPFGLLLYAGVLEQLAAGKKERLKRLKAMAQKAVASGKDVPARQELHDQIKMIENLFTGKIPDVLSRTDPSREIFLNDFEKIAGGNRTNYIETIQGMPAAVSSKGVAWLSGIVDALAQKAAHAVPSMALIKKIM
jgi:UDP-N-acetylglucosamine/UDP-N-acetylgalactosamine diphosphorylase